MGSIEECSRWRLDLPTSRASKAELGARKIYTMETKTEREACDMVAKARLPTTEKAAKDFFGKV